jgi:Leucine-rich repeat (LRR) protein
MTYSLFLPLTGLKDIDISKNHISNTIDFDNFLNVEYFNANSNQLDHINENESFMCNLKSIDVSYNNIKEVTNMDLYLFPFLNSVNLSYNKIKSISSGAFTFNSELEDLNLNSNEIEIIEENTFDTLGNLTYLNLNSNQLTSINAATFNVMTSLFNWQIAYNKIKSLDWDNISLSNVTIFNSSYNKIQHLSECNNSITTFPCPQFNTPIPIVLQSSLKVCDLSFNEIRYLNKYDFFYNRKLEILHLNNNKLTSLNREAFFFNKKLINLRLDFNYITEIKSNTFDSLTSLKTLNLNYNRLKMLNAATFNPMINLLDLEMQYNSLVDIDYDNFILEKQLVWNLAFNEIEQLSKCNSSVLVICPFGPDEYFYNFEFKILDVSHNKLKKINKFDFSAFALQEVINLSNNQINKIV